MILGAALLFWGSIAVFVGLMVRAAWQTHCRLCRLEQAEAPAQAPLAGAHPHPYRAGPASGEEPLLWTPELELAARRVGAETTIALVRQYLFDKAQASDAISPGPTFTARELHALLNDLGAPARPPPVGLPLPGRPTHVSS